MNEPAIVDDDTLNTDPEAELDEVTPQDPPADPSEPGQKAVEFSPEQQEFINQKIVGDKVRKQREAERLAEQERERAEAAEAELAKLKAPTRPEVPPMPDPYDDNYEEKVRARDNAVREAAQFDAMEQARAAQQQQAQQAQQAQAMQKKQAAEQDYVGRAEKQGITQEKLTQAVMTIGQIGVGPEISEHIMSDEQGPSMTLYLADNPQIVADIRAMPPMQAAIYLETQVKPKATAKRVDDPPPPPPEVPEGGVAPGGLDDLFGVKGATFE